MKRAFKKSLIVFVLIVQLLCLTTLNANALETSDIFSNEALVVDMKTDKVLFSKNTKTEPVQIASLTKIMTYVLSVENISDLNTKIAVPDGTVEDISIKGGSNAGLVDGYEYTALDLLYGLMLPSGCDAADVLAKYIGDGDYSRFVEMMNEKAAKLGMKDTVFYSASGLEENGNNNISTEQDMYKLVKYAYNLPYFKKIISTEYYEITGTKDDLTSIKMNRNTNYMMGEYNGAEYYYLYSLGGKTGNLSGAGRCLVSFAQKGDLELASITLGVPNQHDNYHLTDHRKLLDYAFETYSENVTVDIGTRYKSVGIGEKLQIIPTTSEKTTVTWISSDPSVASVNDYGIVTGKKLGQAKITAVTSTGNKDYAYVSVGFYNSIDIKYSAGPSDENGILGYGELDWGLVKDYGIDLAIIRAGYAAGNVPDYDPYFTTNIKKASENGINIMVSFDGYATDTSYAEAEAEYLMEYMRSNIPEYLNEIDLPIVYNLFKSNVSDPETLKEVTLAFCGKMKEYGYDTAVELGKTKLSEMDLAAISASDIGLYIIYKPYVPDYTKKMFAQNGNVKYDADIWQYRGDAYFGDKGIAHDTTMSALYMDYLRMTTAHKIYDESLYPIKADFKPSGKYTYTGKSITADITGFNANEMTIEGNSGRNAGIYIASIYPKTQWSDGSKEAVPVVWEIEKADPKFKHPEIKAKAGTALKDIKLPSNFVWENPDQKVRKGKKNTFTAFYVPNDISNFNVAEVKITVDLLENSSDENITVSYAASENSGALSSEISNLPEATTDKIIGEGGIGKPEDMSQQEYETRLGDYISDIEDLTAEYIHIGNSTEELTPEEIAKTEELYQAAWKQLDPDNEHLLNMTYGLTAVCKSFGEGKDVKLNVNKLSESVVSAEAETEIQKNHDSKEKQLLALYDVDLLVDGEKTQPDGNLELSFMTKQQNGNFTVLHKTPSGEWESFETTSDSKGKISVTVSSLSPFAIFEEADAGIASQPSDNAEEHRNFTALWVILAIAVTAAAVIVLNRFRKKA